MQHSTHHCSVRVPGSLCCVGKACLGTDIRIGIHVKNIKNAVSKPDIKSRIIPAAQCLVGSLCRLFQGEQFLLTEWRWKAQPYLIVVSRPWFEL